jgi:peptidoglycan/LPS O-acetylase OafA/YrhL
MDVPNASPQRPQRLPLLDGLRGIAALVVVIYHAHHLIPPIAQRGYLFVDFFFLLSGYVLALAAEDKLRLSLSPEKFLWRRILRLWPVMAIGALVGLIPFVQAGTLEAGLTLLALALLMIPTIDRGALAFPLNSPQWSLLLELGANAVHAFALARMHRNALIAFVLLSGLILAGAIAAYGTNRFGTPDQPWWPAIPRVMFSYGFGILLAREQRTGRWLGRLQGRWLTVVLLPISAVLGLPILPIPASLGDIIVTIGALPLCLALAVNSSLPEKWVPSFRALGWLSYPLYAVHLPILRIAKTNLPAETAWIAGIGGALLAAGLVAAALEYPRYRSASRRREAIALA